MEQLIFEIQKMQQGNFQDYESFYNLSAGVIYGQIKELVSDDAAAQQVLTDTYNQIYADIGKLDNPESFYDWVAPIVKAKAGQYTSNYMQGAGNAAAGGMAEGFSTENATMGNMAADIPKGMGSAPMEAPIGNAGMQGLGSAPMGSAPIGDVAAGVSEGTVVTSSAVSTGLGIGAKIGIGVLIAAIIGGGAVAIHHFSSNDNSSDTVKETPTDATSENELTVISTEEIIVTTETQATEEMTTEAVTEATTEEITTEATTEAVLPQADYRGAYIDILSEKKYSCGSYSWQYGYSYAEEQTPEIKPVSLFDINGDDIPELFVFYSTESYMANMDIYTVDVGGEAKLLYSGSVDVDVAAGTSYCIFMTEDGKLYHVTGIGDESYTTSYYEMVFEGEKITEKLVMTENYVPNEDYSDLIYTYTIDEKTVDEKKFKAAKDKLFNSIKDVIQYNYGYLQTMAEKKADFHNMTWGEAYALLFEAEPTADKPLPISRAVDMYFSSGAGGWGTEIVLSPNGDFSGVYYDGNLGESGDGYDSTTYICKFNGKFKDIKKVNEYTYQMTLDYYDTENSVGEEWIEVDTENDLRMRYVASDPYGIYGGNTFEFYVPGIAVKDLPEIYVRWIYGLYEKEKLDCYGLFNVDEQCGFGF